MVLNPIRIKGPVTLQSQQVLVLFPLFFGLIDLSLFSIDGLRPGVELTEVVRVVGRSSFDSGDEVLLVKAELHVTELVVLRILIRELLWLNGLTSLRINFVKSCASHSGLGVEDGGNVKFGICLVFILKIILLN